MEEMVNNESGVNESVAAEQTTEQSTQDTTQQTTGEQQTQENTGVETKPVAGVNEGVEKAFAARLKAETEKVRHEATQQARDAVIAEMGYEWKGKPITTEAEYKRAIQEQQLEASLRQQYANVPDEIVNELIESRRFREETKAEKKAREEAERKAQEERDYETRKTSMYDEFFREFPDYNTEDKWKTIPQEVWADANKWLKSGGREGRRMADAMAWHNYRQLTAQQQAAQVNQANAAASPGSVTGNGSTGNDFISFKAFEANKHDQSWVNKNFSKIMESRAKW